jgi:hypothetical protein
LARVAVIPAGQDPTGPATVRTESRFLGRLQPGEGHNGELAEAIDWLVRRMAGDDRRSDRAEPLPGRDIGRIPESPEPVPDPEARIDPLSHVLVTDHDDRHGVSSREIVLDGGLAVTHQRRRAGRDAIALGKGRGRVRKSAHVPDLSLSGEVRFARGGHGLNKVESIGGRGTLAGD